MTNDTRSPEQIERDIERDRQALTENLHGIQEKFSFDTIAHQIGDQFREHGGDISRAMATSVKENPMAVALTGVGLAWMIFGSGSSRNGASRHAGYGGRDDSDRSKRDRHADSAVGYGASQRYSDEPAWARGHAVYGADDDRPLVEVISERSNSSVRTGSSTPSDDKSVTEAISARASEVRDRLAEGTENLSEAARQRIVSARATALDAKRKLARSARRGADKAADLFEQQPLVSGALSFAVGAAIGGALPRTQAEDEAVGEQSDALFAEAERLFNEEQANATRVFSAAAEEAKTIAEEKKENRDSAASGDGTFDRAAGNGGSPSGKPVVSAVNPTAERENRGV